MILLIAFFAILIPDPISTADAQETKLEIPPVTVIKNVHVWDGTSDS